MAHIHLIDDDTELHQLLASYFANSQIRLSASETPSQSLAFLAREAVDLIILDVMLPEMDGFELCRRLREKYPQLPILMLTARGDDLNTILGLELGADDYMSKPFNPRELEARVKTILRRVERYSGEPVRAQLRSEPWQLVLDLDARTVALAGNLVELTATEFDLLRLLLENRGLVLSRDALLTKLRGYDWDSLDRSIDMHISKLRSKLGDNPRKPQMIKTVWGIGYVFSDASV
ncbi:MAG: DNA-binding response regulator [Candidatus Melainabacteria bacterium HGW-Melainabacteria-1]|nr:MAG: DNA-binding response regulator [Candidatus Melainabacteria bacterium HGW-Melainabacteria-1]